MKQNVHSHKFILFMTHNLTLNGSLNKAVSCINKAYYEGRNGVGVLTQMINVQSEAS